MAGEFTRELYDRCNLLQNTRQSTEPLNLIMDITKFVNCGNLCTPSHQYPPNGALLVDVESSLWGLDKINSKCDKAKHPFCGPYGCMLTRDPRIAPHITPYACERGHRGESAVITTNMKMPLTPGYRLHNPHVCDYQGNGYYVDPRNVPRHH